MSVSAVNKFYLSSMQPAMPQTKNVKNTQNPKNASKTEAISVGKAYTAIAAAAIGGLAIGSIIVSRGRNWRLRQVEEHLSEALKKKSNAEEALKKYQEEVAGLIDGSKSHDEISSKIIEEYRKKIQNPLNYNPMSPYTGVRINRPLPDDVIPLPEKFIPANIRTDITELNIPEFAEGQRFEFEVPMNGRAQITKAANGKFTPKPLSETTITETYADSVVWDNDKVARDIMQNFYDGHGQTLDGVKIVFEPAAEGRYKVRIEGKSTYTPDKAILLGESSKQNDAKAAGNFGEGLKMTVLKVLKDSGAQNFAVGSDDWKVTWQFISGNLNNKRVLGYKLDRVDRFDGNYIEFETNNMALLTSLRKTINRFYHSHNTDFKAPDVENGLIGIKLLGKDEQGAFYIAGQRYQVDNSYEGLNGVTIYLKEKPPAKSGDTVVFDPSRDRTSLNAEHLKAIGKYIASSSRVSKQEVVKMIHSLERYWGWAPGEKYKKETAFLEGLLSGAFSKDVHIKFPEKYVAQGCCTSLELIESLEQSGYKVCNSNFSYIGMPQISDLMNAIRTHKPLQPSEVEKQKLILIKEGVNVFSPYLEKKYFNPEELDTKIYLFNKDAAEESRFYEDTMAEAIIDYNVRGDKEESKGFWIDRDYLATASFPEALGTALHELCHKFGGDESSSFSYRLTDVLKEVLSSAANDAKGRTQLKQLQTLWDELSKNC